MIKILAIKTITNKLNKKAFNIKIRNKTNRNIQSKTQKTNKR